MLVVVDTREQEPWTFEGLRGIKTERRRLDTGDYSVDGLEHRISIERKSLDDWTGTILRERAQFYRELDRLRSFEFRAVLIEASVRDIMAHRYTSLASPNTIMAFVAEIAAAQSVPVYLAGTRAEAQILAAHLLSAASKRLRASPA